MYFPIELDKMRHMRYGMRAIHAIEDHMKIKFHEIDFNNLSMYEQATLIWGGLIEDDQSLTPMHVMDLIDKHSSLKDAQEIAYKAIQSAFGESKEGKKKVADNSTLTN